MASFYDYAKRYDEAVVQHQKALELDPNFWIAYSSLGLSYLQKSLNKEAIAEAERMVALSPNNRLAVTPSDIGLNDFKHGFLTGLTLRAAGGGGPEGQHMIANMETPLLGASARPPLD
jgi:tetratricopeptide (TPR) repeat protein